MVRTKGVRKPRFVRRFMRDEDGSATIEACLWLPFFIFFFVLILDATTIFMNQARVHRIVQDANRQYIVGGFKTSVNEEQALEVWIEQSLASIAPSASATAQVDSRGLLTTQVSYPSGETDLTGATGVLGSLTMRVQAIHQTES